jgi:hypothetical protein
MVDVKFVANLFSFARNLLFFRRVEIYLAYSCPKSLWDQEYASVTILWSWRGSSVTVNLSMMASVLNHGMSTTSRARGRQLGGL